MDTYYDIPDVLSALDPSSLDYNEWTQVGMALKAGGFPCSMWDDWSRRDAARYHSGECERKWETFHGSAFGSVSVGTIVQLAKRSGWTPPARSITSNRALDWDDMISDDVGKVVNVEWLEGQELTEPIDAKWNPVGELITYLETLFQSDENVGYVTKSWNKDGKHMPTAGSCDRTAGQLIEALSKCHGDIGSVLGDYTEEAGAWIRFNPLDGKGVKNENVTEYRYALIESDSMDIAKQNAILREMELPIACLVHSGKKSLHAIVKVEASNYEEYKKRVEYLYGICKKNGLEIDTQNRNPSRLSRMPGVLRNGHKQWLVGTNIGKASWTEWREWIEGVNDDLPEIETLANVFDSLPPLAPSLIDGILRQGHKMLIAGPSKAGKSYALIELAIAIAEGWTWLGRQCAQGRVMYVNLELDGASCLHRFADVYSALKRKPQNLQNLDVWNLRGKAVPMDKLAPKLIRRAQKADYIAVILDPIYKVITGDESSADQMAAFCNQFDRICTDLGCAVIYCHHHSKGVQSNKRSMDRASGSGVFARDPDALLDMLELNVTESLRKSEVEKALSRFWSDLIDAKGIGDSVPECDRFSVHTCSEAARKRLSAPEYKAAKERADALEADVKLNTAWKIDGTLREFPRFPPLYVWFKYPIHEISAGENNPLQDLRADDAVTEAKFKKAAKTKTSSGEKLDAAYGELSSDGEEVTVNDLAEHLGVTERSIRNWVKASKIYTNKNGVITLNEAE